METINQPQLPWDNSRADDAVMKVGLVVTYNSTLTTLQNDILLFEPILNLEDFSKAFLMFVSKYLERQDDRVMEEIEKITKQ